MYNGTCNISDYDYECDNNFVFPNGDFIRLFIFIVIIISLILNSFIIYIICSHRRKRVFSFSGSITLIILIVNFFHKASYLFNWVIKNDKTEIELEPDKIPKNIGILLIGNPSNFDYCIFQGASLIFFSISQDIFINIFLGFINSEEKRKKTLFTIILLFAGIIFPLFFTFIFVQMDIIGINEKFCHITKYKFNINDTETNTIEYMKEENYNFYKIFIYIIKVINFLVTLFYIIRAIIEVRNSDKKDKKKILIISSLSVVITACLFLLIQIIFKTLFFISDYEEKLMNLYLILNSLDCIFLPLAFSFKHNIFIYYFCCCCRSKFFSNDNNENDTTIKEIDVDALLPPNKKKTKGFIEE